MKKDFIEFIRKLGFIEVALISNRLSGFQHDNGLNIEDKRYGFITIDNTDTEYLCLHISKSTNLSNETLQEILGKLKDDDILKLHTLCCSDTNLEKFDYKFPNLVNLNLSNNNQLLEVKIPNSPNLESIYIQSCKQLSKVAISGGQKLNNIHLSYCAISELKLPQKMPYLASLQVQDNQLSDVSFLSFLKHKTENNFDFQRFGWVNNKFGEGITNSLQREDIETLKEYFKNDEELIPIKRLKLILLGNTQAGKTTLCNILIDHIDNKKTISTHGINVQFLMPEANKYFQIYDFGGQDLYHNLHLPLFTMNANYLLIFGNGQADNYGAVKADDKERLDDIFPKSYWLNSVPTILGLSKPKHEVINHEPKDEASKSKTSPFDELTNKGVDFAVLENLKAENKKPQLLDQKYFHECFGISSYFAFQLKNDNEKYCDKEAILAIREKLDDWYQDTWKDDLIPDKAKEYGEKFVRGEYGVVRAKEDFEDIDKNRFKLLHDNYFIFSYDKEDEKERRSKNLPDILDKKFITNLSAFAKWLYAVLDFDLKDKYQGILTKKIAKGFIEAKKQKDAETFENAIENIDFIFEYMLYNDMIFHIKTPDNTKDEYKYLVPQYLPKPEEKSTSDTILVNLFDTPFIKYTFKGFYHTQFLTKVIVKFFDPDINADIQIAKQQIGKEYQYLIWKNKVILYLKEEEKLNPQTFLLLSFDIEDEKDTNGETQQQPTLSLAAMKQNSLKDVYVQLEKLIKFIDEELLKEVGHDKLLKTPLGNYIPANLLKETNKESNGKSTDLIYDSKHRWFYRKGDFPLFIDPQTYTMKKIFISYSKSDEKYKNEFKKHFSLLKRQSLIDTFDDSDLGFGEWDPQILKKIEECDFFVCLISIDFLTTDYIVNKELPYALKHNKIIIPIMVRACVWHDLVISNQSESDNLNVKLANYNASLKARVLTLFKDNNDYIDKRGNTIEERDAVWTQLVEQFKRKALNIQ